MWDQTDGPIETRIYILAKIIETALEEIAKFRDSTHSLEELSKHLKHYMTTQVECICHNITNLLKLFAQEFPTISISNKPIAQSILTILLTAQENYFKLLGRDEEGLEEMKLRKRKFNVMYIEWELEFMREWL